MTYDEFTRINRRLTGWYNRNMNADQLTIMWQSIEHIPSEAYQEMISEIINNSKTYPTLNEINSLYRQKYAEKYQEENHVRYDPNETDEQYYRRIRVQELWKAFFILKNKGKESFQRFCDRNHFSADDVDRVVSKLNYAFTEERTEKAVKKLYQTEEIPF